MAMVFIAIAGAITWWQTISEQDSRLISLARSAVRSEVLHTAPPRPSTQSQVRAVFVTIERDGKVLGCRGALTPRTTSVEQEVIMAARAAASNDPKYPPLKETDLNRFLVTVTLVTRIEAIPNVAGLQPSEGLVLEAGNRTGIVLPWEGKDPVVRLRWAYKKAGVPEGSGAIFYRMTATRCRG